MIEMEGETDCIRGTAGSPGCGLPPMTEKFRGALQPQPCGTEAFGFL
jgi:hypothetical protein